MFQQIEHMAQVGTILGKLRTSAILYTRRNDFIPSSNGVIEGANNKIKLIRRRVFGYRNDAICFSSMIRNKVLILIFFEFI
jgi:hypothetical protein